MTETSEMVTPDMAENTNRAGAAQGVPTNAAQRLLRVGYHRILPVVPPNAPMPEGTDQKTLNARGKVPGFSRKGLWSMLPGWQNFHPDPQNVPNWDLAGANVGLVMGDDFAALDVDVTDPKLAILMREFLRDEGIDAPVRVGRAPKFLLLFRVRGRRPCKARSRRVELDGDAQLIEVLGTGRQAVIWGRHPGGFDYTWDRDILALRASSLPEIEPADLHNLADRMAQVLLDNGCVPAKGARIGVGGGAAHSSREGALARNPEALCEAFRLLPNDYGRADWIRLGQALKAAVGDACEAEGFAAWQAWSETGDRHTNPQTPAKEWGTMTPDGSIGAGTIIWELDQRGVDLPEDLRSRLMKKAGKDEFDVIWLDDAQRAEQEAARAERRAGGIESPVEGGAFRVKTAAQFIRDQPAGEPIHERIGLEKSMLATLTAQPGSGKTAVAVEVAFVISNGEAMDGFQGERPKKGLFLAGENNQDTGRRVHLTALERGMSMDQINFDFVDGAFSMQDGHQQVRQALQQAEASGAGYEWIIVDTATAYNGASEENDNLGMQGYYALYRQISRGPGSPLVLVLAHPPHGITDRNLMRPRGGSSILGTIDANLTQSKDHQTGVVTMHYALGKFRGEPWDEINFELRGMSDPAVTNAKGAAVKSVRAVPISKGQADFISAHHDNQVLAEIASNPKISERDVADAVGFSRRQVRDAIGRLVRDGKLEERSQGSRKAKERVVTDAGQAALFDAF